VSKPIKPEVPRLALTQEEAAESLGMSVTAFVQHVKMELPVVFVGSMRRYPVWGLQDWMRENATRGGRRLKPS
jgi:hypothetical protein